MAAKLFNDPQQTEHPQHRRTIKRIDDLILDAEIEAQAEINKKIRSNNTRRLLFVLVGVGLFYALYSAVQNQTISLPSFLTDESQVAEAPPVPGPTPTPIPFPVTESAPASEASDAITSDPDGEDLSPLENEVMSMIQKKLGEPGAETNPDLEPEATEPPQPVSAQAAKTLAPTRENSIPPTTGRPSTPRLTPAQSEFFIQVGAFSVKANADRVIKKLMSGGFSPLVQTRTTRSSMYVVFIGGFADKLSPQNMITELRNKGLTPILKKNDNGSYSVILGKEKSKAKADTLKQNLTKQGIFTSLKQMNMDMRMFVVQVGGFPSNTNAVQEQKKLETLGYKGTLIRKKS